MNRAPGYGDWRVDTPLGVPIRRITVVGDAVPVPPEHVESAGDRYFRLLPESRAYQGTHDFSFFWIEPKRVRHIAGFGQIFWVEPEDWLAPAPDWQAGEAGIVEHMNTDHADAVLSIATLLWGETPSGPTEAELLAVDPEGFHVRTDKGVLYGSFEERASTTEEIRAAFVQLTSTSRRASSAR
ncbi:DUF2470 domain-containing protein [Saltatorellus ferox]|uniref:DUF2470 domain-containing protein n=1 Tax=Saltatorellus ferox TaxID=2528018 RepID=UPI003AF34EA1